MPDEFEMFESLRAAQARYDSMESPQILVDPISCPSCGAIFTPDEDWPDQKICDNCQRDLEEDEEK